MTLAAQARFAGPYSADGVVASFAYTFRIIKAADLEVYIDDVLQTSSAYSVSGVGAATGGNVTFNTAPSNGTTVRIFGDLPLEQQDVDLEVGGRISSASLELFADRLVMMIQERTEELQRRPSFKPAIATALRNALLPDPVALQLIGYNATANGFTLFDPAIVKVTSGTTASRAAVEGVVEITPDNLALDDEATAFVPAGIILDGVVGHVKTELGNANGLTTWSIGTAADRTRWASGIGRTATSESNVGQFLAWAGGEPIVSATDVVVTADAGTFDGTGVIVLTYTGWKITPKTTA